MTQWNLTKDKKPEVGTVVWCAFQAVGKKFFYDPYIYNGAENQEPEWQHHEEEYLTDEPLAWCYLPEITHEIIKNLRSK